MIVGTHFDNLFSFTGCYFHASSTLKSHQSCTMTHNRQHDCCARLYTLKDFSKQNKIITMCAAHLWTMSCLDPVGTLPSNRRNVTLGMQVLQETLSDTNIVLQPNNVLTSQKQSLETKPIQFYKRMPKYPENTATMIIYMFWGGKARTQRHFYHKQKETVKNLFFFFFAHSKRKKYMNRNNWKF